MRPELAAAAFPGCRSATRPVVMAQVSPIWRRPPEPIVRQAFPARHYLSA